MKVIHLLAIILLTISCTTPVRTIMTTQGNPTAQKITLLSETPDLSHAESVAYDPSYNRLYVSIQCEQEPGDGGIATIDLEGNLINKNFTVGLDNPKGIAVGEKFIYVSDVTQLVAINREMVDNRYSTGDEQFLNDVAIDDEGNVYVSDMRSSSIYKLDGKGNFSNWISSPLLENPNGLLAVDNTLYIAAWGLPSTTEGENSKGRFIKMNLDTKQIENITAESKGNLDGLQVYNANQFLLSDWRAGLIYKASKDGKFEQFFTTEASVGDILYIQEKKLLALPLNRQNKVLIYRVDE